MAEEPEVGSPEWLEMVKAQAAGKPAAPPAGGTTAAAKPGAPLLPNTTAEKGAYNPSSGGGGGGGRDNYAAMNAADRKAQLLSTGNYFEQLPPGYREIPGTNKAAGPGGLAVEKDKQTNLWSNSYLSKTEAAQALRGAGAAGAGAATTPGAQMLAPGGGGGYAGSLTGNAPPTPAGTGAFLPGSAGLQGTLPTSAGVTLPGMEAFNIPGLGIEQEGRRSLYDNNGLNTMYASNPNGPQIQAGPGMRNGRFGNSIQFGGSGGTTSIKPQVEFPSAQVSVPGSYVQGQGNVGPMGGIMPFSAPYNIGPGGAGLMNIGGSNVQLNSADKSFGMGFALTPQTPSDKFAATDFGAATGRSLNSDPALAAVQSLQLMAAINQMGGGAGAIDALTAAERNQYSGNAPQSQGTWFSGAAPGPQMTPYEAPGATAPNGNPLLDAVVASAPGGRAGGGAARGPAAAPPMPTTQQQQWGAANVASRGSRPWDDREGMVAGNPNSGLPGAPAVNPGNPLAAAPRPGDAAAALMGTAMAPPSNPNIAPIGGGPAPAGAPAAAPSSIDQQIAALMAQLEEERGGGAGVTRGYSRGGTVNVGRGLPGFARGGSIDSLATPIGSIAPPTDAAPAGDPAIAGSLATPGAAVQNQPTQAPSINPAANAIQPVQGPQNTTSVINNNAWSSPAQALPSPGLTAFSPPPSAEGWGPGLTAFSPPPAGQGSGLTALSAAEAGNPAAPADPLAAFRAAQQKQALQERMRTTTFANRWRAAGLEAPTAIQLDVGEQPQEALPPGSYYSISNALQRYMDQISGRQTTLAGLGTIGDPNQLMAQMTQYEQQQAPYKEAIGIGTQLAGLGAGGTGDPNALAQQQALLKEQMGPLAQISDLRTSLAGLGTPYDEATVGGLMQNIAANRELLSQEYPAQDPNMQSDWAYQQGQVIFAEQQAQASADLMAMQNQLSQMQSHNNQISQARDSLYNLMQAYGVSDINQLDEALGSYAAQQDALKTAYNAAMQGEGYRNQIASLTGGKSATDEMARYQQLINEAKIGYGNVETAQRLNNEIQNLAKKGASLPGFAKGGSWIAGATKNAHGQFRAKAQKAGMSTKAYASKMADAPGRTGKQARLAKTLMGFAGGGKVDTRRPSRQEELMENVGYPPNSGRMMNWFPGYADGGSMTTEEPIIGIGLYTGQPRFQVGEPQYPGGPPMAERLNIEPLNRPSLPLGGMRRAA